MAATTDFVGVRVFSNLRNTTVSIDTRDSTPIGMCLPLPNIEAANETAFPIDEPVRLATDNPEQLARLGPGIAYDAIRQIKSEGIETDIIFVRARHDDDLETQIGHIAGDANAVTGAWALAEALSELQIEPGLVIAPGFDSQRLGEAPNPVATTLDAVCEKIIDCMAVVNTPETSREAAAEYAADFATSYNVIAMYPQGRYAMAAMTAEMYGPGQRQKILETNKQLGVKYGVTQAEVDAARRVFIGANMDLASQDESLGPTLRAAVGSGSSSATIASAGRAYLQTMKGTPADLPAAYDIMAKGGKLGTFELEALARNLPALGSQYAAAGGTGLNGLSELVALAEVAAKGAASEDQAANNLQNFLSKLFSPETVRNFKEKRVNLPKLVGNARQEGKHPALAVLDEAMRLTDGDPFKMGELFADQQVMAALRPLMDNRELLSQYQTELQTGSAGTVQRDFDYYRQTPAGLEKRQQAEREAAQIAVGQSANPASQHLSEAYTRVWKDIEEGARIWEEKGAAAFGLNLIRHHPLLGGEQSLFKRYFGSKDPYDESETEAPSREAVSAKLEELKAALLAKETELSGLPKPKYEGIAIPDATASKLTIEITQLRAAIESLERRLRGGNGGSGEIGGGGSDEDLGGSAGGDRLLHPTSFGGAYGRGSAPRRRSARAYGAGGAGAAPFVGGDASTRFLNAVAEAEGTRGYNTSLGHGRFLPGGQEHDLTSMTLDEVSALGDYMRRQPGNPNSSALGRYQIVGSTMRTAAEALGMDPAKTRFDKTTQDRMALWIAKNQGLGAWEGFRGHAQARRAAEAAIGDGALRQRAEAAHFGAGGPLADLSYANSEAIRNRTVTPQLEEDIRRGVAAVYGEGYRAEIYSGGQPAKGTGGRRTGSTRHDDHGHGGEAPDLYVYGPDGKKVRGADLARLGQHWVAQGLGGVGLEMGGGGIHLDQHRDRARHWHYGIYSPEQAAMMRRGLAGEPPEYANPRALDPENFAEDGWAKDETQRPRPRPGAGAGPGRKPTSLSQPAAQPAGSMNVTQHFHGVDPQVMAARAARAQRRAIAMAEARAMHDTSVPVA
ncbi:phage tail tape measure protein [Afifella marina]|uniref:Phage-related minor tail protein n=1 Tax=Afifella marina DSM 2698 TaxID=1120955 RepID=A0A1G5MFD0_AFIMA|nr:phage tail tape measure protein [Afifella marina]MBK1625206.1 hypothetical protein [Afifella marina DSM 2698]MBK1628923.1 hypothetical protein [Afifella marina]MBK5918302.1 hypothetical protein [Afifella marina]RAI22821.1 hypothetical protein CH311_03990 [Afifella marina DSM 2698]SCZ23875.1 Phage-related minor tail protein [Afifella marina DSM 2698]